MLLLRFAARFGQSTEDQLARLVASDQSTPRGLIRAQKPGLPACQTLHHCFGQQKTDPPAGWIGDVPAATKGGHPSISLSPHVESSESWVPRLSAVLAAHACAARSV